MTIILKSWDMRQVTKENLNGEWESGREYGSNSPASVVSYLMKAFPILTFMLIKGNSFLFCFFFFF